MHRAVAGAAVLMLASAALAAEPADILGLKIGMTRAQVEAAMPECANAVPLIDRRFLYCRLRDGDQVLFVAFSSGERAYSIQYEFNSDRPFSEVYAAVRGLYALGDRELNWSNWRWGDGLPQGEGWSDSCRWTWDDGATLVLFRTQEHPESFVLILSNWKIAVDDNP